MKNFVPKFKSSLLIHSDLQVENETLKRQVTEVSSKLEESEDECVLAHDTLKILETKLKNAESKYI
jgi:hypothetical protein